jgi:tRNA threonylcarbamoyladenosine biosynthesis protein TsaE
MGKDEGWCHDGWLAYMIAAMPLNRVEFRLNLANEAATRCLGASLAPCVQAGWVMTLQGDLGAGKTTLTRALLRALGVQGTLRSPSYALLEPYDLTQLNGGTLHHFDFYRLEDNHLAWKDAGFQAAFEAPHAAIVEWPQYALGLPQAKVQVSLVHQGEARLATVSLAQDDESTMTRLQTLNKDLNP